MFKLTLLQKFVIKDLGHSRQFSGIEMLWQHQGMIGLRQFALIGKLLFTYGMEGTKETHNQMNKSDEVPVSTAELNKEQAGSYRSIVSSLFYIAIKTRPDISTAASILGTFVSRTESKHLRATHRVLKYLPATTRYVLALRLSTQTQLSAYSDASLGDEAETGRKSRSGIILFYGKAPIYLSSCSKKVIALSSTEAE